MKVYMHNDNIYATRINKNDKEYDMAISPSIVLQDGKPLYAFVLENDAIKYCNARNESKDGHLYEVKHFMFYEKRDYGREMYVYTIVLDTIGHLCERTVNKTYSNSENNTISFYYDNDKYKHIVGIFKNKDEVHFEDLIQWHIDACMNLTEN